MNDIISLKTFIMNRDTITTVKVNTFCSLMKCVNDAMEKLDKPLIRVNLDEILINIRNGQIVFPDNLFANSDDLDKTISGFNTGISVMADRKSTIENRRVSFALMVLGWYVNNDHSAVLNDMLVLENFDNYMMKVPLWLQNYFIEVFRKMNYNISFSEYYKINFSDKVKNEIKKAFSEYNLNDTQFNKISSLVAKATNRIIKESGVVNANV